MFNAFKIVNQVFNGLLFTILTVVLDIFLISMFNKEINIKLRLELNQNKAAELKEKKRHLFKMVIINGCIYIVSHALAFVWALISVVYSKKLIQFCTENFSCDLISEEVDVFFLIGMMANFFIFRYFNSNFIESYQDLKRRIRTFL